MSTHAPPTDLRDQAPGTPSTLGELVVAAATRPGTALRYEEGGAWRALPYSELGEAAREIAGGLVALGIEAGDRVAVLSDTRVEWTLADCGALSAGAVVVPVYQTSSPEEVRYVLEHSGARLVFCEDQAQLAKVEQVRADCPSLENVVALTGAPAGALPLAELRERCAEATPGAVEARIRGSGPDDPATIIYTSGTTGPPKGCVLSHRSVTAAVRMYGDALALGREPFSIFLFLPLAHALARVAQFVVLDRGGTIAFWRRDPRRLVDDLAETEPSHFPTVPRVLEKVRGQVLARAGGARGPMLRWALRTGGAAQARKREGRSVGALLRARHAVADRLVLSRVRAVFGARIETLLTGAAPIGRDVLDFFEACGLPVLEGYGLTETCAAATLNTPAARRPGTVGRPLAGVELRLADDGEVLIRGANVFDGYRRDAQGTREVLADGWLRSGDLGSLDADGYLTITGRKKDVIITSSGKNITPSNIETALAARPWISQAVVYGDDRPYLVALVTLDRDELRALAERAGAPADPAVLADHPGVREALQAEVDVVNRRFARIEQVKRFAVLDRELTQAAGELTPTMKVKRAVVYDRYRDAFDGLYR
jgi:long-chain acyl-CoA synthetase